jgi:YesN/AraC family two-component response regulator
MEDIDQLTDSMKDLTLLYVEDDISCAKSTIILLENFFKKVIYATDGKDGLEKFNENYIDLIITDIRMPKLNGLDMLEIINKLRSNIPAIITSAHDEIAYYEKAKKLNVKEYILKPISLNKILNAILEILDEMNDENTENNKINYLIKSNKKLVDIGYQISNQKTYAKVLDAIIIGAKELTQSDGGTLYLVNKDKHTLDFSIVINDSLDIKYDEDDSVVPLSPLKLYNGNNIINHDNVAVVCAMEDKLVNISDILN